MARSDPAAGGLGPTTLRVLEVFDSLQGEGYWTGVPMTFVRLAGCNAPDLGLDCVRWCDTEESWSTVAGEDVQVGSLIQRVGLPRVCLTGGEPLLQVDGVAALLEAAHQRDLRVHLETNGTLGPVAPVAGDAAAALACLEFDWVVVSPKPPEYVISPGWEGLIDELKLIADDSLDAATAERLAAAHPGAFVCVQPVGARPGERRDDPVAQASVQRAIDLVISHPDWRLSLQTHKLLGLR